jgi:uncharacterized membrane protein YphA (DoxX/SURF4 family)
MERKMDNLSLQNTINQIFKLLKYTFGIVPIVTGLDKFTNLLTNWEQYINPTLSNILPFSTSTFMMIVGIIEIVAGIIVLIKTELGGYIVAAWLIAIALSLLIGFNYVDIAARDLVMAISAFCMARIAKYNN